MSDTQGKYGWARIASTRHAAQLLRREIKQLVKISQQRGGLCSQWRINRLLDIAPGTWYQFVRISDRPWALIILSVSSSGNDDKVRCR